MRIIKPQPKQEEFLSSSANITVYGGAAGGGKTFAAILAPLRFIHNPGFGATIFRRTYPELRRQGSILDASKAVYPLLNARLRMGSPIRWTFPSGATVELSHMQDEKTLRSFDGAQMPLIIFDELCQFTEEQFFYLFSRNRSVCGVKPHILATCNPDAEAWAADFLSWWIDQETGYAIGEKSGIKRYFIRNLEEIIWGGNPEELLKRYPDFTVNDVKSVSFIPSSVYDNDILMEMNPDYVGSLKGLSLIERERKLYGNWKIRPAAGLYFKRSQIRNFISVIPSDVKSWIRGWDFAATSDREKKEGAYTASVLMGKRRDGTYIIADVTNDRLSPSEVRATVLHKAQQDKAMFGNVKIRIPQDPGQAGKAQKEGYIKFLSGYSVWMTPETGNKETRAEPMAAQWQGGNFELVVAPWNDMYVSQLESFPESKYKDMVDASSSAFAEIERLKPSIMSYF